MFITELNNTWLTPHKLHYCVTIKITFRIKSPHVLGLVSIVRSDLNLVRKNCIGILLKKHLVDGHVQSGDYFLRVADELAVEIPVKTSQMGAVEI